MASLVSGVFNSAALTGAGLIPVVVLGLAYLRYSLYDPESRIIDVQQVRYYIDIDVAWVRQRKPARFCDYYYFLLNTNLACFENFENELENTGKLTRPISDQTKVLFTRYYNELFQIVIQTGWYAYWNSKLILNRVEIIGVPESKNKNSTKLNEDTA